MGSLSEIPRASFLFFLMCGTSANAPAERRNRVVGRGPIGAAVDLRDLAVRRDVSRDYRPAADTELCLVGIRDRIKGDVKEEIWAFAV
jgi:hypothetical protein